MSEQKEHGKPIEIFTALDLEMAQPSNRIIQIGAVCGNIKTGEVFERLSVFVNPHEQLTTKILELTGIKQEDVDGGVTLEEGYDRLKAMHRKYKAFLNPLTFGGGDSLLILKQLKDENPNFSENDGDQWCFGRRWIDVKTLYVSWRIANEQQIQGGLKNACKKVKVQSYGPFHRADMDALNTFNLFRGMLEFLKNDDKV